jgi:peptidoglycan hydrolase CwlO-like protein
MSRCPLLNDKKPQLVMRLRETQQQVQALQQRLATLADACLQRDARAGELEAKLAELEPYRDFVEQIRQRIQRREEYRNDTSPSL